MWIPVTPTWRVLRLRIRRETASRYGGSINHSVLPKGRSFTANSAFCTQPSSQPSFSYLHIIHLSYCCLSSVDPGGPVVIILATGSEVRGFKRGRGRWIFFQSVKILSKTSYIREVKPWVPCRRFAAHKRT